MGALPERFEDTIITGDAISVLRRMPGNCCHLAITSPPYWNMVDYGAKEQIGQSPYEKYLADLLDVWREAARVLVPNGKLCINAAKQMHRRYVGIDVCEEYNEFARNRLAPRVGGRTSIKIGTRLVKKRRAPARAHEPSLF